MRTWSDRLKIYMSYISSMVEKRTMILIGVVIVAVVAVAAYALLSNPDGEKFSDTVVEDLPPVESGNYTVSTGDTMKYIVSGYYHYPDYLEGTVTVTILDQNETQQKTRTEWSVYLVDEDGEKTLANLPTEEQWSDKQDPDFEKDGTRTVRTLWGQETLDYYTQKDGNGYALVKEDITFAQYIRQDGYIMYLELVDCDSFTQQKIERKIYDVEVSFEETWEYDGGPTEITLVMTYTNKDSEIFKIGKQTETFSYMEDGEKKTETETTMDILGSYSSSQGDDVEHTTEKIETKFGSLEVDVYTIDDEHSSGVRVRYYYSHLLVKETYDSKDSEYPFHDETEMISIKLNGESVKPDAILPFLMLTN